MSKNSRFQSYKNFKITSKDSNYLTLLTKYFDNTQNKMKDIIHNDKNMSNKETEEFMNKMFSLDHKRMKKLKKEVEDCYSRGLSTKSCAKEIIKKYYNITKVNKYKTPTDGVEEITEITENLDSKIVSESLFWVFIKHINNLDSKFIFDISSIGDLNNTLNHKDFLFYMETEPINYKSITNEFTYSRLFKSIIEDNNESKYKDKDSKFYIGVNDKNKLEFGYIIGDEVKNLGEVVYYTRTFSKLIGSITVKNENINLTKVFSKFKTVIKNTILFKSILKNHLKNYDTINGDNIRVYISIINDKITLIVDTMGNDDVVNEHYLSQILKNNKKYRLGDDEFNISKKSINSKTFYYINF